MNTFWSYISVPILGQFVKYIASSSRISIYVRRTASIVDAVYRTNVVGSCIGMSWRFLGKRRPDGLQFYRLPGNAALSATAAFVSDSLAVAAATILAASRGRRESGPAVSLLSIPWPASSTVQKLLAVSRRKSVVMNSERPKWS